MSLPYNKKNKRLAQYMRKNATRQENHLWYDFLNKHKFRFRRQVMIDDFIADFYCPMLKLIIEIDGSQHYTEQGIAKDDLRTEKLGKYGILVIRISNRCIDRDFIRACTYIDNVVQDILRGA